jgi:iodotyrosine deiodinase
MGRLANLYLWRIIRSIRWRRWWRGRGVLRRHPAAAHGAYVCRPACAAGNYRELLLAAGTAPNGANMQPWHFVVVGDPAIKQRIREAAEAEERAFYEERAPMEWLQALEPFDTDWNKPFLATAPYLIVIFAQSFTYDERERKVKHYYVTESVGIATGMLITAVHHAGLVSLTHTPSPMKFLNEICGRPEHERPYLILVVGYPTPDAEVPNITKKSLNEIATFL